MPLSAQSLTTLANVRLHLKLYTLTAVTSSETLTADTANITYSFAHTDLAPNYFGTFAEGGSAIATALLTIAYDAGTITFSAVRTGSITCASYRYFAWDYTKDKLLEQKINEVSGSVSKHCKRKFIKDTYTEYYKGSGRQKLVLNQYPVNKITSVKVDSAALTAGTDYITSDSTYLDEGIIFKNNGWTWYGYLTGLVGELTAPVDNIEVVYSAGYTLEPEASRTLPYDLEQVVISMVADTYGQQQKDTVGLKHLTEGKLTYIFNTDSLVKQYEDALSPYVKRVF